MSFIRVLNDGTVLFKGDVTTISYRDGDPSWQAIKLNGTGKIGIVTGEQRLDGAFVDLKGKLIIHPKYGEQVSVEAITINRDKLVLIEMFLNRAKIRYVTPAISKRMITLWGKETLEHIKKEELLAIKGIGAHKAKIIEEDWYSYADKAELYLEGMELGLSPDLLEKAIDYFGEDAINVIKNNPYEIVRIKNVNWHFVERLAQDIGFTNKLHPGRVILGTWHSIRKWLQNGDTWVSVKKAWQLSQPTLQITYNQWIETIAEAINDDLFEKSLILIKEEEKTIGFTTRGIGNAETELAKAIAEKITKTNNLATIEQNAISEKLTAEQKKAVLLPFSASFSVMSGDPGRGKSYTLSEIVRLAEANGINIYLVAPTGKAAKRMQELTGHHAETVHKLTFEMNKANGESLFSGSKYENSIFILDETSMLDIFIGAHFMSSVPDTSNVMFVGDPFQLPSVSPGSVLRDVIISLKDNYKERYVKLTKNFRQKEDSLIITNALALKVGKGTYKTGNEFKLVKTTNYDEAVRKAAELLDEHDVCLTFFRKDRDIINSIRQNKNPEDAVKIGSKVFKVGDPVIQTTNNRELNFFNGETGEIIFVWADETNIELVIQTYDGREVVLTNPFDINDIELAYAITTHKSQGSEYERVLIFPRFHESNYVNNAFLTRSLFYTAITRAKKEVSIIYYQARIGQHFFSAKAFTSRNTRLQQLLNQAY